MVELNPLVKRFGMVTFSVTSLIVLWGCVEPFNAVTNNYENALVIDALLTTELKRHSVSLFRTYTFEAEGPEPERNAEVSIIDNVGNKYNFFETEPGVYLSLDSFSAISGTEYILIIETIDGGSYRSKTVIAPSFIPITDVSFKRIVKDEGDEGVSILLNNSSQSAGPNYFRYEYEETYKIIAPNYDPFEFLVVDYTPCDSNPPYRVDIVPREEQKRVCFGYSSSITPVQTSTIGLSENKVQNFELQFLNRENYIISHRYSILIKQYTQTQDAYSYYERLGDFSTSDNVFSQSQPGFLEGNIISNNIEDEKVLGYFEVATVDEKRTYFNYKDLFPEEPLPPYAVICSTPGNPELVGRGYHCAPGGVCDGACESPLIESILAEMVVFRSVNENITRETPGPYFTLPSPCGDCTKLGSNVVPEFWID